MLRKSRLVSVLVSFTAIGTLWSARASAQYPYLPPPFYPPPVIILGGEIRLLATPKDAEVYFDGRYTGVVDNFSGFFQHLHVPPGDHAITLHLAGYRTVTQKLAVAPGATYKIHYAMEKLAAGEQSEAPPAPTPSPIGVAPPMILPPQVPPPGQFPPSRGPTQPAMPAQQSNFGTLVIRVQPGGSDISIDGEHWHGPENDERLLVQVADGMHRVEIVKGGYRRFSADVQVHVGDTVPVNVSLSPE